MKIHAVSAAPSDSNKAARLRSLDGSVSSRATSVSVLLSPASGAKTAAPAASGSGGERKEDARLVNLLSKGTPLEGFQAGRTLLISKTGNATAQQLAGLLHEHSLTGEPAAAVKQAESILEAARGKSGSAILIGAGADGVAYSLVEVDPPKAAFRIKLILALVLIAAAVAAVYFRGGDKPEEAPAAAAPAKA